MKSYLAYHGNVKVVEITPLRARFRLHYIDLFKLEGSSVPDVGQDGPRIGAQSAVLAREECDPTGLCLCLCLRLLLQ